MLLFQCDTRDVFVLEKRWGYTCRNKGISNLFGFPPLLPMLLLLLVSLNLADQVHMAE